MEKAISMVEYKVKVLKNEFNLQVPSDKIRFLKEITKVLSSVENRIEREIYIGKISEKYNISKEAIYAEVNKSTYNQNVNENNTLVKNIVKKKEENNVNSSIIKRENMIIYLLINHFKESYEQIVTNITVDDFKLEVNKLIFQKILESSAEDSETLLQNIANIEDSEIQSHVSEILVTDYGISSIEKCIDDVVNTYNRERLTNRKLEIIKSLENSSNLNNDIKNQLESELNNIMLELAKRK